MQQFRSVVTIIIGLVLLVIGAGEWENSAKAQDKSGGNGIIRGTVRDQKNPLYGILVKARQDGKNSTTSVVTDARGQYVFPPMPAGSYTVSVGTKSEEKVNLDSSPVTKNFVAELGPGFLYGAHTRPAIGRVYFRK